MSQARFIHAYLLFVILQFKRREWVVLEDRHVRIFFFPLFSSDCIGR